MAQDTSVIFQRDLHLVRVELAATNQRLDRLEHRLDLPALIETHNTVAGHLRDMMLDQIKLSKIYQTRAMPRLEALGEPAGAPEKDGHERAMEAIGTVMAMMQDQDPEKLALVAEIQALRAQVAQATQAVGGA